MQPVPVVPETSTGMLPRLIGDAMRWQGAGIVGIVILNLLTFAEPLLIKVLVDAITAGKSVQFIVFTGTGFAVLHILRNAVSIGSRERIAYAGQRAALFLRGRLYEHIQGLNPINNGLSRGEAVSLVMTDAAAAETLFSQLLVKGFAVAFASAGATVGLFLIDVRLALIAIVVLPVFAIAAARGQQEVGRRAEKTQAGVARLTNVVGERLAAAETIQLGDRERVEARHVFHCARGVLTAELDRVRVQMRRWGAVAIISGLTASVILTLGAVSALAGGLALGSLLAFYMYVDQLFSAISSGAAVSGEIESTLGSIRRVERALRLRNPVRSGRRLLERNGTALSFASERVSFTYDGSNYVLNGLDFLIEPGEHVAVVGPSGCGKSTLVRLIARFFDPAHGRILINGLDVRELDVRSIRRAVAILPQSPGLLDATIADNIAFRRNVQPDAIERAGARAMLDPDLLTRLHVRTAGHAGESLSGGQRQRIALARLFLQEPRMIVLDEPTSQIDEKTESHLWQEVRDFAVGRTLLAVTHNLSIARSFPRILVFGCGKVTADVDTSESRPDHIVPTYVPDDDFPRAEAVMRSATKMARSPRSVPRQA